MVVGVEVTQRWKSMASLWLLWVGCDVAAAEWGEGWFSVTGDEAAEAVARSLTEELGLYLEALGNPRKVWGWGSTWSGLQFTKIPPAAARGECVEGGEAEGTKTNLGEQEPTPRLWVRPCVEPGSTTDQPWDTPPPLDLNEPQLLHP